MTEEMMNAREVASYFAINEKQVYKLPVPTAGPGNLSCTVIISYQK